MDRAGSTWRMVSRGWQLAGPLFDRELRVAGRRGKYYLLRSAYVGLLALVILRFWHSFVRVGGGGPAAAQVAHLGQTGKGIIVTILWFQFLAAQILATVLLSDAISGEIRRRTLDDLLVTPLRAIHIVAGKLLVGLLHVILLLAISLPVLAVARVFGGVPWDYVVSGLCITVSAAVFAGALSLLCSTLYRDAYRAVLVVGFWYLALWGLDAFILVVLPRTSLTGNPAGAFLWSLISPFHALYIRTQTMLTGPSPASPYVSLTLHCLTILLAAAAFLVFSARRVRRIARPLTHDQAEGGTGDATAPPIDSWETAWLRPPEQPIRPVKGVPLVWKDLNAPLFRTQNQVLFHLGLWLAVAVIVLVVMTWAKPAGYGGFCLPILILQWAFLIRLGVAAAGAIAREKEARTWPIVLALPLDNREIITGKAIGALRRNVSLLIPLLGLYLLAFLFDRPGERNLPRLVLSVGMPVVYLLGSIVLLLGAGLSAGIHCRTMAGAVATVFGTYLGLVFVSSPLSAGVLGLPAQAAGANVFGAAASLMLVALIYGGLGSYFLWSAAHELRRDAFGEGI